MLDQMSSTNESQVQEKLSLTRFLKHPSVFHVMPSCDMFTTNSDKSTSRQVSPITGITVLGNEVFVIRNTSQQVNAYNSNSFASTRNINFSGSKGVQGIVACPHNNCLYLSASKEKVLHRYDLRDCVAAQWLVGGKCWELSVTKHHTVLASLKDEMRIQEYTTYGSIIKDISLSPARPEHCVQRSDDNFVILYTTPIDTKFLYVTVKGIYIVDKVGCTIGSYINEAAVGKGSENQRQLVNNLSLSNPQKLPADTHDNVLVTDNGNNRVQLLSPTLTYLGDIKIPGHQMNEPHALHFDELNNRLYIGEWAGGRMFVLCVDS